MISLAQEEAERSLIKNNSAVVTPGGCRASQRCCAEHYQNFQTLSSVQKYVAVGDRVDGGLGSAGLVVGFDDFPEILIFLKFCEFYDFQDVVVACALGFTQ